MKKFFTTFCVATSLLAAAPAYAGVLCEAKGVWGSGTTTITVHSIDKATGAAKVTGSDDGIPWSKTNHWIFADGLLQADTNATRWRLRVEERSLRGSYVRFGSQTSSRPDLTFVCREPLAGVFVNQGAQK